MKRKQNPMPDVTSWLPGCGHGLKHCELIRRPDANFHILCKAISTSFGACYEKGPSINLRMLDALVLATAKEQQDG